MSQKTQKKPESTREYLLMRIEDFLTKNPNVDAEAFGWAAIKDCSLVERLRAGGDVTTRKLDAIIRFMSNLNKKESLDGK